METDLTTINSFFAKRFWKILLTFILRMIVSGIILYFIISLIQWKNVLAAYQIANGQYIAGGAILLLANLGVRTIKWQAMLKPVKDAPTLWEAFGSVILGISLGSFTPGEIGEFAGRALHISDTRRSYLVGLTLLDKAQIFIVTSAAGLTSLIFLKENNSILFICLTFIVITLSILFFLRLDLLAKLGHHFNASFFQRTWLTRILDAFCMIKSDQLIRLLIYTIIFHGVLVLQMYCLINAFGEISLFHAFIGTSAMMFVKSLLPISLGDLGIREASSIILFSSFSISQAAALNSSLLLFFINIFIPGIFGTFFLKHHSLTTISYNRIFKKSNNKLI